MKNLKVYLFLSLFIASSCHSMEIKDSIDEMSSFVGGPLTKLAINDEIWTISLLNLTQWKPNNPEKIDHNPHFSKLFEAEGELNKVDYNIIKQKFIKEKWEEKYPNIKMPNLISSESLLSQQLQVLEEEFEDECKRYMRNKPEKIDRNLHSAVVFEGSGDLNTVMDKFYNMTKEEFIKDKWEEKYPNTQMPDQISSESLSSQQLQILEEEFEDECERYVPNKPEFEMNEKGVWMLMVHLIPDEEEEERAKKFKNHIFSRKKGLVDFRGTKAVQKIALNSYFDKKKGTFKKYELVKSWNILGKTDGWNGIMQAYLNQSELSFSLGQGIFPGKKFNCASFAMAILRCCSITVQGGIWSGYDTTLFGSSHGNSPLNFTPILLKTTYFPNYFYRPTDRKLWKRILPELKKNQNLIDPSVEGLDLMDRGCIIS